ncbi:MAG TPA: hypothetical protein VJR03_07975 [Nitrospira sp.]|nr:hypothetical protein [Nitrospira sp.]
MIAVILILVLLTGGCIDVSTRLQPEDSSVNEILRGTDCVPIVLGMGFGTASIDKAMADAHPIGNRGGPVIRITKVRRVTWTDSVILFVADRCIEVVGE